MAQVTFKGNPVNTLSELPKVGDAAPDFSLTKVDLSAVTLADLKGKKVVLNIFPSLDTPVCASSVRKFNAELDKLENVVVLSVSKDLPFAHNRFCESEGLKNVVPASEYKSGDFGRAYGVLFADGPLEGLFARSIVVLDEEGKVTYTELVSEVVEEPNYEAAIAAVK